MSDTLAFSQNNSVAGAFDQASMARHNCAADARLAADRFLAKRTCSSAEDHECGPAHPALALRLLRSTLSSVRIGTRLSGSVMLGSSSPVDAVSAKNFDKA